jgi:predicted DsbA family dithiol-disulfide isomerase
MTERYDPLSHHPNRVTLMAQAEPFTLEIFSDYVCPWCYLNTGRIEKVKKDFDIRVKFVHFPLHPETPADGMTLEQLFGARGDMDMRRRRNAEMKERMDAEGLPYGERTHTYNSRLAQELGTWADTQPGGEAIHDLVFKAYFVDNRNIGDIDVLVEIAGKAGLDAAEARKVLEERRFKEQVDEDWGKSRAYGITGVPTVVANGYGVAGAQPVDVLEEFLEKVGVPRKNG